MEQQENSNGSETKVYERALEISRNRLTELTWNNILYEANLDVMKIEAEEDKVSEEVIQLQLHIQELLKQNEEISNQRNDFENKYTQMDVDYTRLQELDDTNSALRVKIESLQNKLGILSDEDLGEMQLKIQRIDEFENDKAVIVKSLNEANEKLSLSDKTSAEIAKENKDTKEELRIRQQELDLLRPKVKELESQVIKGRSSTDAYSELEQEFLNREKKYNEMQQRHNMSAEETLQIRKEKQEVESALATQKKLYTELLQRSELKEEEYKLELEKLKPTPKKKGRPKKEIVQDGGLLGSA